jgi:hypothetical protein
MITLRGFTAFAYGHDNPEPEVYVNPAQVAYVEPRIVTRGHEEAVDGTIIYFQQEAGVLAVRESLDEVVAELTGSTWQRRCTERNGATA